MSNWYELAGSPVEEENVNPITNYNKIASASQTGNWWESEHDARTNYNLRNDPDLTSGNWWDLHVTPLDNVVTGPPELFSWEPEIAQALPATATFTRASTAQVLTTTDGTTFWYQEAKSGEVRLDGLRRVENVVLSDLWGDYSGVSGATISGDDTTATFPGSTPIELVSATTFVSPPVGSVIGWRIKARTTLGTATMRMEIFDAASAQQDIEITTTPKTFFVSAEVTSALNAGTRLTNQGAGGPFNTSIVIEEITASFVQSTSSPPIPYVQFGVTYNAEVAGVRYFNTTNGNSVDGNGVVTEGSGTTITGGGYLPEPAATNLALHSRDFTNAAWVATNITPAQDATGIDGATQASTLTATAANGTILQTITSASSAHTFAVFVARKTGTGTIEMTIDGGTTWVDITSSLTSDITDRFTVTQTLANPSIGFRIVTSGDEIEVDVAQLEATAFSTSPIITSGSTVTRVKDSLSTVLTSVTPWSCFADITAPSYINAANDNIMGFDNIANYLRLESDTNIRVRRDNADVTVSKSSGTYLNTRVKIAANLEVNNGILAASGATTGTDGSAPTVNGFTGLGIGQTAVTAAGQLRGRMHEITVYGAAQTQAQLEDLVA